MKFKTITPLLANAMNTLSTTDGLTALKVSNPKGFKVIDLYNQLGYNNDGTGLSGNVLDRVINRTVSGIYYKYLELTSTFGTKFETRMEFDCDQCNNAIRNSNVIFVNSEGDIKTLWDIETGDDRWNTIFKGMSDYIKSLDIIGLYVVNPRYCEFGKRSTLDSNRNKDWYHMSFTAPTKYVTSDVGEIMTCSIEIHDDVVSLFNKLSIDTWKELDEVNITNNADIKKADRLKNDWVDYQQASDKDFWVWANIDRWYVDKKSMKVSNRIIGEVLKAILDNGIDGGNRKYRTLNNPLTRNVSSREVSDTEMTKSINELIDMDYDLDNDFNGEVVHKGEVTHLWTPDTIVESSKTLSTAEKLLRSNRKKKSGNTPTGIQMSLSHFVSEVLPKATKIEIGINSALDDNRCVLTKLSNPYEDRPVFNHGNPYAFSYVGGRTNVISQRVKDQGGNNDAPYQFALSWDNQNNIVDMDLGLIHNLYEPITNGNGIIEDTSKLSGDTTIGFNDTQTMVKDMMLDIDANRGGNRTSNEPVENIFINRVHDGHYAMVVHNYTGGTQDSYDILVKRDGVVFTYHSDVPLRDKEYIVACKWEVKNGKVENEQIHKNLVASGQTTTVQDYKVVTGINITPNYWDGEYGNAHYLFEVDGLKWDDRPIRFLHNEFLSRDLYDHRRTLSTFHDIKDEDTNKYTHRIQPTDDMGVYYGFDTSIKREVSFKVTDEDGNTKPYMVTIGE